jgi:DNA-binding protein HU-beta
MQKTDLIAQVAKEVESTQDTTGKIVNAVLEAITTSLKNGEKVTLTGFGTLEVKNTKARTGVNPRTGEKLNIPAGKRISFSAGALLKEAVGGKKAAKKAAAKKAAPKKDAKKK